MLATNLFPAASGDVVTQAHTDLCAAKGHATHTVDGVDTGICPRCGEVKAAAPVFALRKGVNVRARARFTQVFYTRKDGVKDVSPKFFGSDQAEQATAWATRWVGNN